VPTVLKSGSLNLLEPSGPVEACDGIALPLPNSLESGNLLLEKANQKNKMEEGNTDALLAAAVCLVCFALTFKADC